MDPELKAMSDVATSLSELDDEARVRVLSWVSSKFNLTAVSQNQSNNEQPSTEADSDTFDSVADLFDATHPATSAEKALVVAYFMQEVDGESDFGSQSVNTELKHLGHGVSNITSAFSELIKQKFVLQINKSGKSQQARKKYKLTRTGINRVKEMINQGL